MDSSQVIHNFFIIYLSGVCIVGFYPFDIPYKDETTEEGNSLFHKNDGLKYTDSRRQQAFLLEGRTDISENENPDDIRSGGYYEGGIKLVEIGVGVREAEGCIERFAYKVPNQIRRF